MRFNVGISLRMCLNDALPKPYTETHACTSPKPSYCALYLRGRRQLGEFLLLLYINDMEVMVESNRL